jgi:hypothetical protein
MYIESTTEDFWTNRPFLVELGESWGCGSHDGGLHSRKLHVTVESLAVTDATHYFSSLIVFLMRKTRVPHAP